MDIAVDEAKTAEGKSGKNKSKLAVRFRNINLLFIVLILSVMAVISIVMIFNLTDNASKDYVRFYTMESVDVLGAHLNKELSLVQFAVFSDEIIAWFADEENHEKKAAAYQKMMHLADMLQINGVYFVINESLNEYSIDTGTAFERFVPFNRLATEHLYDQWYFDAVNSNFDFTLNLDVDKVTDTSRLWINHKVVDNGKILGVFCSALQFDEIFAELFAEYDSRNVLGFIVNEEGFIQINSSMPNPEFMRNDMIPGDDVERTHILEINSDPAFISVMKRYLDNPVIYYDRRVEPEVIKLSLGSFQYLSVSPIPNSNWLAVTFFDSRTLFHMMDFITPIIAIIIAFIIYVIASSFLAQRVVFRPLSLFTSSISASDHNTDNIYGIERDDEIGELARETQESWIRLNDNSARLLSSANKGKRQAQILYAVNAMAASLFSAENEKAFDVSMPEGLKLLTDCMDFDQIYIWRNVEKDGLLNYTLIYAWLSDKIKTENLVSSGTNLLYEKDAPLWLEKFLRDEYVYGHVKDMSGEEASLLAYNGVKSVLAIPVHLHGQFWGFISFDYCNDEHTLSKDDIDILHSASLIIASAINRNFQLAAIREAHEYSSLLLDAIPLSCLLWDKNKKLYDCNKKTLEVFQISTKEEYEKRFPELVPEYQPDGRHSLDTMFQLINSVTEKNSLTFEWMHQLPNGEPLPMEVKLVNISFGGSFFIATYLRDMREQKQMMLEIEQRDMLLQTVNRAASVLLDTDVQGFEDNLYKSMGMMAKAVDADRVYIWKNHLYEGEPYATQLYEWSEEAMPLQGSEYAVNVSYKDNLPDWYEPLSRGECVNSMACNMMSKSQDFLYATQVKAIFIAPIFMQDEFWGFVGFDDCHRERVFTENEASILHSGCLLIGNAFLRYNMTLSLKEAAEEANAASHSKSAFLANMSHEIRTPMNSIVGFSELAMDDDIPPKTKNYLSKILKNSEWLLQIINDILDISKIESGKVELENIPFDLHEMFAACRTVIMPRAIEKGLTMHFYAEPSVGKRLYGDPTRLRQVLVNLLSNAVKFTNTGMIKMMAAVKDISADSVSMYFEIKDSGIGITSEQMSRIFDPFVQAETSTTRKYGGSGLGLSITINILEMMGSKLSVESTPGVGSKFNFELTFDAVDEDSSEDISTRLVFDDIEKPAFEGNVLLCEDNAMNQQVICEHLARVGLHTDVAQNGREGVDMVKARASKGEKQYDLIFMDIHMPVMDGLEASAKIFEFDPGIPIVAMTANIMSNDRDIYQSKGMKDCMAKPFTSQELWRCLMKYFTPVIWQKEDSAQREQADTELRQKLINNFVRNNQEKYGEIAEAINTGDIKLAHRLAHTLKSNAGQLNKKLLQKTAEKIEQNLKDGANLVTPDQMEALETELKAVMMEFSPQVNEHNRSVSAEMLDNVSVKELLEKLEPMLDDGNIESLSLIDSIRSIPGNEELVGQLINQMEAFDFVSAVGILAELKQKVLG